MRVEVAYTLQMDLMHESKCSMLTDGKFITSWGSSGSGQGQFIAPTGIAVDLKTGNVYVSDTGNNRIDKFTPDGKFMMSFGSFVWRRAIR